MREGARAAVTMAWKREMVVEDTESGTRDHAKQFHSLGDLAVGHKRNDGRNRKDTKISGLVER